MKNYLTKETKKNVCFVMNGLSKEPIGGHKMIFEYANRLCERSYKVQILVLGEKTWVRFHLPERLRKWLVTKACKIYPKWFKLDKKVEKITTCDKKLYNKLKDTDIFIATAVTTAESTKRIANGKKCAYFIQDYENWVVSDDYCQSTYRLGMINIVISTWLKNIIDKYSAEKSILIKNPVDINSYKIITEPKKRKLRTIGILYHKMPHKGLKYSVEAVYKLKELYPDLEVYMFGVPKRPKEFPSWIHYTRKATQKQTIDIYNKVSVWICATIDEGFGLTGLEAMACGCTLVSTAYTGVLEYAENEKNALLSPVKDVDALVNNVKRVFDNEKLRSDLLTNAQESIKDFSWEKAVDKFEAALEK